jgi:non-ribosomal peptide synthetase component E (peptide arylation enzyme)
VLVHLLPLPQVRGPIVLSGYYSSGVAATDADGWFDTGDVATIDRHGYMQVGAAVWRGRGRAALTDTTESHRGVIVAPL